MKVISLKIKNFLSIGDVEIKPGKITQIAGQNGQGKTSIIKALNFAVEGSNDPSLVKLGEDSAEVLLELSDSTTIRRRLNSEGKQSVTVERDGMKAKQPQTLLDVLFDHSSFNPLDLINSKNRTEAILRSIELQVTPEALAESLGVPIDELPPLDYSEHGLKVLAAAQKYFYQRRAEANKTALEKKNRWDTYKADLTDQKNPPKLSRDELKKQKEAVYKTVDEQRAMHAKLLHANDSRQSLERTADRFATDVKRIEDDIAILKEKLLASEDRLKATREYLHLAKLKTMVEIEPLEPLEQAIKAGQDDINDLNMQMKEWDAIDAQQAQIKMVDRHGDDYKAAAIFASKLDQMVNAFPIIRRELMENAEMPVKGLEFKDDTFTIKGVSVDNLSSSQALKLAVAVARKLAKKSKVICVDGAEQLDDESWEAFRKETDDDGFSYFVTKVGDAFKGGEQDIVVPMKNGAVEA